MITCILILVYILFYSITLTYENKIFLSYLKLIQTFFFTVTGGQDNSLHAAEIPNTNQHMYEG